MSLVELINRRILSQNIHNRQIELLKTIDEIYHILKVCGFRSPEPLNPTPERFAVLSPEKIEAVHRNLFCYLEMLKESPLASYDIEKPDTQTEKRMAEIALKKLGYQLSDKFFSELRTGDVVEFYDPDMMQVYRNLEFFKYCSYNLIDLISLEWYELYERPSQILQLTFSLWKNFLDTGSTDKLDNYNIPEHLIVEKLLNVQRVFKVKLKDVYLLRDSNKKVSGIAHSLNIGLVAAGPSTNQIAII